MKKVTVTVSLGLVGCKQKKTISVDDDETEDAIWSWEPVE